MSNRHSHQDIHLTDLRRQFRSPVWLGAAAISAFFVLGGGWAATADLSGAVIAEGSISPEGSRQTVQHLEGGIIRKIHVTDGDVVEAGEILIELEDVSARAEVESKMSMLRALAAKEARLIAERDGAQTLEFNHPTLADAHEPTVAKAIETEEREFEVRQASPWRGSGTSSVNGSSNWSSRSSDSNASLRARNSNTR